MSRRAAVSVGELMDLRQKLTKSYKKIGRLKKCVCFFHVGIEEIFWYGLVREVVQRSVGRNVK